MRNLFCHSNPVPRIGTTIAAALLSLAALTACGEAGAPDPLDWGRDAERVIRDAVGNLLQDGDSVSVIKDLKVKGSSLVVKVGTKVKNIRLCDGDHDIDCKIDGIGAMKLKSEFVRKV